jgi:hypothetical protein
MAFRTQTAGKHPATPRLADFTTDLRVIPLSLIAIGLGVVSSYLAVFLLKLIDY